MATRVKFAIREEEPTYQSAAPTQFINSELQQQPQDEDNTTQNAERRQNEIYQLPKARVKIIAWIVKLVLFVSVLTCLVFSKITVIKILTDLHLLSNFSSNTETNVSPIIVRNNKITAAKLYWILLFMVLLPTFITWVRSLLSGFLSKSPRRPWPKRTAIITGILNASVEAIAECLLIFYAFVTLPPAVSLIIMCGVMVIQSLYQTISSIRSLYRRGWRNDYLPVDEEDYNAFYQVGRCHHLFVVILTIIGVLCQVSGLGSVITFLILAYEESNDNARIMGSILAVPCLLVLSVAWSSLIQKSTFKASTNSIERAEEELKHQSNHVTAKWKANFIASSLRLLIYPIASYIIFRFLYKLQNGEDIDPWTITRHSPFNFVDPFKWDNFYASVFIVHVVTSFLAYSLSWISCYMTLHVFGLALPLILSTPLSLVIYFLSNSSLKVYDTFLVLYPFQNNDAHVLDWTSTLLSSWYIRAFACGSLLWLGQVLASSFNLFRAKNAILASDENMFVRPYYNSVLIEQSLIINRDVTHKPQVQMDGRREPAMVFVCSTMFRENTTEMRQMLRSLKRIAKHNEKEHNEKEHNEQRRCDRYESHIFFDGGCREDELSPFAIQLMSLIPRTLDVKLDEGIRQKTPYGYRFSWLLNNCVPFMIHLKDNHKVRNKKRWSQVMYMKYIIKHRYDKEGLQLNNTFILTTDADIDFKAESAIVLLDMLARDPSVGAVCSHTHPLGNGPLYWYQKFDYIIGHWLQKSTEHMLGSVLCCPGCFSMFRCSALNDCLKEYSTEVEDAMEFLTKDMGEDRWLCTLLVEKRWRLEYCAISNNYTYCPVTFDEFYKQRRRWIPSTIANLWLLVKKAGKVTSKNESISWAFIIYQLVVLASTIISPATVILVIGSGLSSAFPGLHNVAIVVVIVIVALLYGLICVYTSQKTQLDTAKVLTFLFSVVMTVVVVGIIKENVESFLSPFNVLNETNSDDGTDSKNGILPFSENTFYLILFAFVFTTTAFLHLNEFFTVFQCLWFLLGLPSGYLLLLIYSLANLNDRRWGTREAKDESQKDMLVVIQENVKALVYKCLKMNKNKPEKKEEEKEENDDKDVEERELHQERAMGLEEPRDYDIPRQKHVWLMKWLRQNMCEDFYNNFAKEGYTEEWFVAGMTRKDLVDIGICPNGYLHRLEKAIKKIPQTPIQTGMQKTVEDWIVYLKLDSHEDQYILKFHRAGYCGSNDVENLIHITRDELMKDIGVKKKAHVKRFMDGIQKLKIRTRDEERVAEAEIILQTTNDHPSRPLDDDEYAFWSQMAECELYPIPEGLTQTNELRSDLKFLRNYTLLAMLLINLMWLLLLSIFTFVELGAIGLSKNILGLLFLAVYSILLTVQFIGMLLHRVVTLSHYIARLNQALPIEQNIEATITVTTHV